MKQFLKQAELAYALRISPSEADRIGEASGARSYHPGFKCNVYDLELVRAYMRSGPNTQEGKVRDKIRKAQERKRAQKAQIITGRQCKLMCGLSEADLAKINENRKRGKRNG